MWIWNLGESLYHHNSGMFHDDDSDDNDNDEKCKDQ